MRLVRDDRGTYLHIWLGFRTWILIGRWKREDKS